MRVNLGREVLHQQPQQQQQQQQQQQAAVSAFANTAATAPVHAAQGSGSGEVVKQFAVPCNAAANSQSHVHSDSAANRVVILTATAVAVTVAVVVTDRSVCICALCATLLFAATTYYGLIPQTTLTVRECEAMATLKHCNNAIADYAITAAFHTTTVSCTSS
eukprot:21370-Heterococcus_DN1.PRE.2